MGYMAQTSMPEAMIPSARAVLPLMATWTSVRGAAGISNRKSRFWRAQAYPASRSSVLRRATPSLFLREGRGTCPRGGARGARAPAPQEDLLVEGDQELRIIAAVADLVAADADAVAARAGDAPWRRLDLCRGDLPRPDVVAHPGGGACER